MTRKLEEELGLPPMEDEISTLEQHEEESAAIVESLSTAEKLELALATVKGIDRHENEMDDISGKAISSYEDLVELGKNSPPAQSGRIYEVAGQMLKHALDAKNSKADKKLKLLELQFKKLKLEQDSGDGGPSKGDELDRNELLTLIRSNNQSSDASSDK